MKLSVLTICGIDELPAHSTRAVTHVLSVLDPDWPDLDAFHSYGEHHRTTLRFHDIIDAREAMVMPAREHVSAILRFGSDLADSCAHLLVHCHAGVSRSTAAMLTLLAQAFPRETEDRLFERLRLIRAQAWPNSLMVSYADDFLGRQGRLMAALGRHYRHQLGIDPTLRECMTLSGRGREVEMGS